MEHLLLQLLSIHGCEAARDDLLLSSLKQATAKDLKLLD